MRNADRASPGRPAKFLPGLLASISLAVLVGLILFASARPIDTNDFWWHAKLGWAFSTQGLELCCLVWRDAQAVIDELAPGLLGSGQSLCLRSEAQLVQVAQWQGPTTNVAVGHEDLDADGPAVVDRPAQ